jgi:hypothetical protein
LFERLLELFFHAKSGVFAGIFLIGTTGALVTATVSNGVATITITTQVNASPSASASASPTASPTSTATASPTVTASASPSAPPSSSPSPSDSSGSANNCSEQAHEINSAVKTVNSAYSQYHTDLVRMRDNKNASAKDIVENAEKLLKGLRQNAVKAIHDTKTCAGAKDDDDDDEENAEGNFLVVLLSNLQSLFGANTVTVDTTTVGTSSDPKTIAEDAVAAMQIVFDEAKAQLDELPEATARATKSPKPTADSDRGKGKGKKDDD